MLYRANITAGWGCPASDLGSKGFSLGILIPQCSLRHSPAVTQWGQGENTGLDTVPLHWCWHGAGWWLSLGCPSIPSVPCGPQEPLSLHASQGQGNSPVPLSSWGLWGGWHQCPPFPLPLSQGQAEHKGCKQGAQGDTGTRDTLWGPGWPGPSPELWRNGKPKLGGPSLSPVIGGERGRGPRAGCPVPHCPRCPLAVPGCPRGRWGLDKAMPQLKVVGGCWYRVWQRGRAGGA